MSNEMKNKSLEIFSISFISIVFGVSMFWKRKKEIKKIKKLWSKKTTLKELETMARKNKKLPEVCIVQGILKSDNFIQPFLFKSKLTSLFKDKGILEKKILISELFVTRLSSKLRRPDVSQRDNIQKPRKTRTNVFFQREEANNIQLESICGNYSANLILPDESRVLSHGDDPNLFLSTEVVYDPFYTKSSPIEGIKYHHLSKYIHLDVETENDTNVIDWSRTESIKNVITLNLLQEIGENSNNLWKWIPKTFYGGELPTWGKWLEKEMISFEEYKKRLIESKELIFKNSEFENDYGVLSAIEKDNGFRAVSLSIPNNERVTIVAKPIANVGDDGKFSIQLVSSDSTVKDLKFRIIKGEGVSDLLSQKRKGLYYLYIWISLASACGLIVSLYELSKDRLPDNLKFFFSHWWERIEKKVLNALHNVLKI
jgi:hypothetical protein